MKPNDVCRTRVEVRVSDNRGTTEVDCLMEIPVPDPNGNPWTIFRRFPTRILSTAASPNPAAYYVEIARVVSDVFREFSQDINRYVNHARHLNYPKTTLKQD